MLNICLSIEASISFAIAQFYLKQTNYHVPFERYKAISLQKLNKNVDFENDFKCKPYSNQLLDINENYYKTIPPIRKY